MKKDAIICVDDEILILVSLVQELKDLFGNDFIIETAPNGESALQLIHELDEEDTRTSIIISDWMMPGMKGDELIISARSKYPHIKGILITGQAEEESIDRACSDPDSIIFIEKPWHADDLISAINKLTAR